MDQGEQATVDMEGESDKETDPILKHSETVTVKGAVNQRKGISYVLQTYDMPIYYLFYIFGSSFVDNAEPDLLQKKVCENSLGLDEALCNNISANGSSDLDEVLKVSNTYLMYQTLIATAPAIVIILFIGPWSDKYGYKGAMLWATGGEFVNSLTLLLNAIFFKLPVIYMVLTSVPIGLTGGDLAIGGLTAAYVGSKTTTGNRVVMLLLNELACSIAASVSPLCAGVIFRDYGHTAVFTAASIALGTAVLWDIAFVREQPPERASCWNKAKDFFAVQSLKDNFSACTKKRSGWLRESLWMLLLCDITTKMASLGDTQVTYYFTQKMYSWDLPKFTEVNTIMAFATMIFLPCTMALIQWWKIRDLHLGIFVAISVTTRYLILAFAYEQWLYYLSCVFGAFAGTLLCVYQTLLMSCVEEDEYGKILAIRTGLLAVAPLVASPVATAIFNGTITYFVGAVFLYCGCLQAVPILIFLVILRTKIVAPKTNSLQLVN